MIDNIPQYDGIGVYKITHSVNGKVYIGSALNCFARLTEHSKLPQNERMLADSEYGFFTAEIVKAFPEGCTNRELMEAERYYCKLFEANTEKGYNDPKQSVGHNERRGRIDDFVFPLRLSKKQKQLIKAHADKTDGGNVNGFIQRAIREQIQRDNEKDEPQ